MIFNLASIIYWQVVTARNQRQVNIDNSQKNARQVTHNYVVGDLAYAEKQASTARYISKITNRIYSLKSSQTVQFESRGTL